MTQMQTRFRVPSTLAHLFGKHDKVSPLIVCLALGILTLLYGAGAWSWLVREGVFTLPPRWDQAALLTKGLVAYQSGANAGAWLPALLAEYPLLAPMLPMSTHLLYLTFGMSRESAYLTNLLYTWPLIVSLFFLTAHAARSRLAGWLAVWLVLTMPGTIIYSREYLPEPVLAAWMTVAILLFVRSDRCQVLSWALAAGVALGLALLSRKTAIAYLSGPLLVAGWQVVWASNRKRRIRNALAALGVGLGVASLWYFAHWREVFQYLIFYGVGEGSSKYVGLEPLSWLQRLSVTTSYIFNDAVGFGYTVIGLIVFLVGGSWAWLKRKQDPRGSGVAAITIAWVLGIVLFFMTSQLHAIQFYVPLLPPMALLMAWSVVRIPVRTVRLGALVLVFIIGLSNIILFQVGVPWLPKRVIRGSWMLFSQVDPELHRDKYLSGTFEHPPSDWQQGSLTEALSQRGNQRGQHIFVAVDHPFLNTNNIRYALTKRGRRTSVLYNLRHPDAAELEWALDTADCVVAKSGMYPHGAERFSIAWEEVLESMGKGDLVWQEEGRWPLPDGTDVVLFGKGYNETGGRS